MVFTAPSSILRFAVEFTAIPSFTSAEASSVPSCCPVSAEKFVSCTCIRFWVSVPVLSVHIIVAAPIVSQACILRTRLLVLSMRFMLSARLNVTDMGNPSGTDTTISVTAIMKLCNRADTMSIVLMSSSAMNTFAVSITNVTAATAYPILLITPARRLSCNCNGVSRLLSMSAPWFTLPYSVASPTRSTHITPCPSTTVVLRSTLFDG